MTTRAFGAVPAPQKSYFTTFPAPVGGLNARDSLADMPKNQAIILENFFPTSGGVQVRKGWLKYYYDIPADAPVETLIKYNGPTGTEQIFAAAGGDFIDVSAGGAYDAGDIVASGFLNNRWQYVQLANQTGDYTVTVNGADIPQFFNGTTWAAATITADAMIYPEFDATKLIVVAQMHRRLWFVERDSTRVWYLPVDQISGDVKLFDLGEVFPLGGYCMTCLPWSVDTGQGMDDQSVFISSKGNVAVFTGDDPDTAPDNFSLVGVYTIGAPVGRRCACSYGSDVLILSEDGVVPLTTVLSQSKMLMQPPLSDIIQHKLSQVVDDFNTEFGWDLFTSARHNQLYVNVPDPANAYQFVMNTILDAWCTFTGYTALCWENLFEEAYFGALGYVGRAWEGAIDNPDPDTAIGTSIQTRALQAFNYFGGPQQKSWSMARPIFIADTEPAANVFFNVDFEVAENFLPLPPFTSDFDIALWDVALWDVGLWGADSLSWKRWYGLNNIGFAGAIFLKTGSITPTNWIATDFIYIMGGAL